MRIDIATTAPQFGTMIYILVVFLLLLLIIRKIAWTPISKILNDRQQKIINDLNQATEAKKSSDVLREQSAQALNDARSKANEIVEDAKLNGHQEANRIIDLAQARANAMDAQARIQSESIKRDAFLQAKNDVADLSVQVASKIIEQQLKVSDHKKLIDRSIDELIKEEGDK